MNDTTPSQHTEATPRIARVEPARIVLGSPGLMAMVLTPRALNTDPPIGPLQVSPPSVDLYSPTPASQPLLQALASPVPTHSVLPVGSLGSSTIDPTELISNEAER